MATGNERASGDVMDRRLDPVEPKSYVHPQGGPDHTKLTKAGFKQTSKQTQSVGKRVTQTHQYANDKKKTAIEFTSSQVSNQRGMTLATWIPYRSGGGGNYL
jgi:hypothetical protein